MLIGILTFAKTYAIICIGRIFMGPYKYKVLKIEGEYVTLLRTDTDTNDTMFIAMALLPDGIDIGTELIWENFEYRIL